MKSIKFGTHAIPAWVLIAVILGAGSFAIAVQGSGPDEQGKFVVNKETKPKTNSFIFTGMPVTFDFDDDLTLTCINQANPDDRCLSEGKKMINSQEIMLNFNIDVGKEIRVTIPLTNHSEDPHIIEIKATTSEQVILDIDEGTGIEGVRSVAKNVWLMNTFFTDADCPDGFDCPMDVDLIVNTEHPGAFSVMLQLLTVG